MPEVPSSSSRPGSGSKPSTGWQPPTLEDMQAMLPQYQFVSLLGRGGMGAVYKAVQVSLDRPVAVKVLPGDLIDDTDAQFAERFKNEARTMAKMNHPSIVNVYDFGETNTGLLYIVMEFIDGTDVSKMIAGQGKLPENYALSITAHVCDALAYAHRNGVIHRDIKPANILINMDGAVKVADFGLAKQNDSGMSGLTKTNMAMGTPDFVAPEALIPGVPLDGRADLYAVGVMLYQMLTGEIPRGMWTMPGMRLGTDPRFDAIIGKAMQTDREARYQSAAEVRKDLDTILTTPRAALPKQQAAAQTQPSQAPPRPVSHGPRAPQQPEEKQHSAPPPKKVNLGMIIGLGATAVLLIGGYLVMKPATQVKKATVSTPPAASTPASTPKPAPKPALTSQPSAASGLPPLPSRVAKQTLDLLALTDPVLDRVSVPSLIGSNEWKREGGELVYQPDGRSGKLAAPVAFDCQDYEIEFKAKKHSGNDRIHVDVPLKNGRILPLILNAPGRKVLNEKDGSSWSGFADGLVHVTIRVIDGAGSSDRIVIQRQNVKGNPLANWSGDLDTLAKPGEAHPAFPKQPVTSVFVMKDKYAVQMWTLRVFEGEAKVLRETTASVASRAPAQSAPTASGAVNLLATVDPKRSTIEGNWSLQNGELHCRAGSYARLAFDHAPPEEYDFLTQFTRTAGTNAISQHVVHAGHDVMWLMGGFGNTTLGFELVGGKSGKDNATAVKSGIENGRRYESVVKVRRDRLQVELDGKLVVDYKTNGSDLSVNDRWKFPNSKKLGIGCQNDTMFHRIELIPFTSMPVASAPAVATSSPAAPSATMPVPAAPVSPPVPPPANDPVSVKLADFEAKFQAAFERDAGAAYKAQLAKLNTGYVTALDRALAEAAKAGKLDDAVALREEKQRIAEGKSLPPEDLDTLPESLKKLRATWRGAEAGYAKQRNALAAPLFDAYDRALDALQTELTKLNKIDDALRVKTGRDELAQRRVSVAPAAVETPVTAKAALPAAVNEASSSWRRAAEWILGVGGEIRIRRNDGGQIALRDANDLPAGRFDILSITIDPRNGKNTEITDDDFTRFNGLRDIESVRMAHLPSITGSGFAAFAASADSMESFAVYDAPLQPQHLGFITQFKKLRMLELNHIESLPAESLARIQVFKELTQLRLLGQMKLDDKALLGLGGLTKLTELNLPGVQITDEGLVALKGMKGLISLELSDVKGITGSGFVHLAGAKELLRLQLAHTAVDDAALAHLSGLTKLRDVALHQTAITDAGMRHLAMCKDLRVLEIGAKGITGATLSQLSGCKELVRLDLYDRTNPSMTAVDDAGLQSLAVAGLPKLTDLALARGGVTDAGLAHLSDMKLTKLRTNEAPGPEGLRHIAAITTLEFLELGRGSLTDEGLAILSELKALKTLMSDESQVTDAGLKVLEGMRSLKTVTLGKSQTTQAGRDALSKARPDLKVVN
jgi:serine/threonine protein kinase